MSEQNRSFLEEMGFRFGANGAHAARTMMLAELATLLSQISPQAEPIEFSERVVVQNVLGKPTKKARELALRHLTSLYALDPVVPLFRVFRRLWDHEPSVRPVLALQLAIARDPLLRGTQAFVLGKKLGEVVTRQELEQLLEANNPDRFSPASLKSFAQNVNGTWTSAGYLQGRSKKVRVLPRIGPANIAYALYLAHLHGVTGQQLFLSNWVLLLGLPESELEALAAAASQRGMLVFLNSGGVKEVRFPELITNDEEAKRREASRV